MKSFGFIAAYTVLGNPAPAGPRPPYSLADPSLNLKTARRGGPPRPPLPVNQLRLRCRQEPASRLLPAAGPSRECQGCSKLRPLWRSGDGRARRSKLGQARCLGAAVELYDGCLSAAGSLSLRRRRGWLKLAHQPRHVQIGPPAFHLPVQDINAECDRDSHLVVRGS